MANWKGTRVSKAEWQHYWDLSHDLWERHLSTQTWPDGRPTDWDSQSFECECDDFARTGLLPDEVAEQRGPALAPQLAAKRQAIMDDARELFRNTAKLTLADFLEFAERVGLTAFLFDIECAHFATFGRFLDM